MQPKSDRSIQQSLDSLNQTLANHDQVIAEQMRNKQKVIEEFVPNNAFFKAGDSVLLTTPGSEPESLSVEEVQYSAGVEGITYFFSDGSNYNHKTLEGEGYDWQEATEPV